MPHNAQQAAGVQDRARQLRPAIVLALLTATLEMGDTERIRRRRITDADIDVARGRVRFAATGFEAHPIVVFGMKDEDAS